MSRRTSRRGAVVATAAAAVVAVALPAWAYFALTSNSTTATVTAASLGTPGTGTPSVSASSVSFAVTAPASGVTPTGFRVDRTAPTAAAAVCSLGAAGGTCTDFAPVAGQANTYLVYALRQGWQSTAPATVEVSVPTAPAPSLAVASSTASPTAGTAFTLTLTAKSGSATDTSYAGTKTLSFSGGQTVGAFAPAYPSSPVTFANGVATVSVTLHKAGAQTLTVADANTTAYTGSATVTVAPAAPRLSFSTCNASHARNSSFATTVTRTGTDPYGNAVATPAITVALAPSSGNAKFSAASVTLGNGALASASVTVNTASSAGVTTNYTATLSGYATATCSVTTTS